MVEVLLIVLPSILWLLYRLYLILKTPVEKLLKDLSIEIPHSPNICIDSIAENSIVLHWDIEIKFDEKLNFVVLINDQEAATLTSTSCKLNNLKSKSLYKIEIIAINSITNFKSQSKPVYVQTYNQTILENELNLDDLENGNALTKKQEECKKLMDDLDLESITSEQINQIQDPNLLNDYLIEFQNELIRTNTEFKNFQSCVSTENNNLQKELQYYKTELEEETDNKNKKDHDVKSLERSKDILVFQKSKLSNQLNLIKNSLSIFNSKFKENENKIKKLTERNKHALDNEANETLKVKNEILKVENDIVVTKSENEKIEDNLKAIALERKEVLGLLNQIKPLIEQFNQLTSSTDEKVTSPSSSTTSLTPPPIPIFNKDGSISKTSFDALVKIFQIMPSWQDEIMNEINNYQEFEQQWRDAFKNEIKKFVTIHQSIEMMKFQKDINYQPIKLNEYQASIEFGGFGNALPKPKFVGKRNFSPSTIIDEKQNFYNHYSQVYSNENNESREGSPQSQLLPPISNNDLLTQSQQIPLANQYSQPQHHPYISLEQINAATTQAAANLTPTLTHSILNNHNNSHTPLNGNATLQGFPYDDQIYTSSIKSPLQTNNLLYTGTNNNSFLHGYNSQPTLSPNEVWNHPTNNSNQDLNQTQNSTFLMTPSQSSNIWLDEKLNGHTRSVSNNSLWRNEPSTTTTSSLLSNATNNNVTNNQDFQPFSNLQSIYGNNEGFYNLQNQFQTQQSNRDKNGNFV
ncbi:unnamed protein product [Candida verbasci]|uniref:Fibronectin type-III domain-containing protein n=1 Tax=Candida verbasci TaxID=1227364 RepID=A0A9W4TUM8_9ASCO|nr:unnamed protein product [Candida verbasci]